MFHYPILFYSISVTNKGTNSNNIIDVIITDSVLRAVINLHWFEWRFGLSVNCNCKMQVAIVVWNKQVGLFVVFEPILNR